MLWEVSAAWNSEEPGTEISNTRKEAESAAKTPTSARPACHVKCHTRTARQLLRRPSWRGNSVKSSQCHLGSCIAISRVRGLSANS